MLKKKKRKFSVDTGRNIYFHRQGVALSPRVEYASDINSSAVNNKM